MKTANKKEKKRIHKPVTVIVSGLVLAAVLFAGYAVFFQNAVPAVLKGERVLLAGDSRSSTDYTFYRELLEKKSGCKVLVEGASGKNAAYNASDEYFTRMKQEHDFSIWLVGGNDDGSAGTVGTFSPESELSQAGEPVVSETDVTKDYDGGTFIQAVDHMMRKYKGMYDDAQTAPQMIFCTDLPQQRDSKSSPWSLKANWERKRLAILECCKKNDILCLDLYKLCGFDMEIEPMYHEPTDMKSDNGVYYMDGLHPNRRGMDLITGLEIDLMEKHRKSSTK